MKRLFADLPARPPLDPRPDELGAVGGPMDGGYVQVSNLDLPAGYTYFAQFAFHDLTCGRPARLDLRPLYGDGPRRSPQLYREDGSLRTGRRLGGETACDLPRDRRGTAIVGDPRNDRTMMLAQVHAAFLQLHNLTLAAVPGRDRAAACGEARRRVERQYRWLVVHDLLPRLAGHAPLERACAERSRLEGPGTRADAPPLEFSLAVGRVGHAMVKPRYRLSERLQAVVFGEHGASTPFGDLRGQPLDARARIDWAQFFPVGNPGDMQRAAKLNTKICRPLLELPGMRGGGAARSIACRTLAAEEQAGLASGQDVARALGFEPLPDDVLWRGTRFRDAAAPLWFYVLREAEHEQHGRRLGEVGASILTRVVLDSLGPGEPLPRRPRAAPAADSVGELLSAVASGCLPEPRSRRLEPAA